MLIKTLVIVSLSAISLFLLFFLIYLFLISPGKKRAEMDRYKRVKYAHRGLHNELRPENSLSAFSAAVEAGYGIELDVRLSRDGELVVFHDDTLDRMTCESGRVDERDFSELSKIKLNGSSDTIPAFRAVLEIVSGRVPLLVEIKEDAGKYGVTEKTLEVLSSYKGEYIIESFNPLALGRVKKKAPRVMRGHLSQNFLSEKKYRSFIYFLLQNLLLNVICRPDFIAYRHTDWKNAPLRMIRGIFNTPTLAFTVRSKEEEALAYEHGFDGVIFEGYIPD